MSRMIGSQRISSPDGSVWQVGRRWATYPFPRPRRWRPNATDLFSSNPVPDLGGLDLESVLIVIGALLVIVLIVIPLFIFGIELIAVAWVCAASVVARLVLRRPWIIEARAVDGAASGRVVEVEAVGWRASRAATNELAADIAAGRPPFSQRDMSASVAPPALRS
jgi:hypothetical protein